MAKYTLELSQIDPVFDFEYDFYDNEFRCDFERKFIDHYYFHEIGFETIGRFKYNLKAHLNKKMPYYSQLYRSELASQKIDFLLNKDLKETFIRELESTGNTKGTSESDSNSNTNTTDKSKVSSIADGVSKATITDGYLTGVSDATQSNNAQGRSNTTNNEDRTDKQTESTTLISQGNIGVTSSAELLEKWRSVMINLDEMIIDECRDLFMGIM